MSGNNMELIFKAILDRSGMTTGLTALKGQIETFTGNIKKHGILGSLTAGLSQSAPGVAKVTGAFGALVGVVGALGAAFGAGMAALSGFVNVLKEAVTNFSHFEQGTLALARFTGSISEAQKIMKDMDNLGEKLSVPDEDLVGAYTLLRLIGGQAMATAENIQMIADAAAAGRGSVQDLARGYAIVASQIESGEGTGRFGMALARSGTISFEGKEAIDQLSKMGETKKAMELFNKEWQKFSGASEQRGNTLEGVTTRLKDSFGDLFKELAKPFAGPLIQAMDTLANTLKIFEPLLRILGAAIGSIVQLFNTFVVGIFNAVDGLLSLSDAVEMFFGSEKAGERFEKRLESIAKRTKELGQGWKSIVTGTLNEDKVRPIEEEGSSARFDETLTEARVKNIKKLEEEIAKIKRDTAFAVLEEEEKVAALDEEIASKSKERIANEKAWHDAEKSGEANIASLKEAALQSQLQELELTKKREEIERKIVEMKRKEAEESAKRAKQIYENMLGKDKERDFDSASRTGKFALNAVERAELQEKKEKNLAERSGLQDKVNNATTEIDKSKAQADLNANILAGAEIDEALQKNRHQREDMVKSGASDVKEASKKQEDYALDKLLDDLKSIYTSEKTTQAEKKAAMEKEIQLRQSLADKMMKEAQELDMLGEKAKAIDLETEAMKMKDGIEALKQSMSGGGSGQRTVAEGNVYDHKNMGLAANMMGIQYQAPQSEDTKYLANIDTTMKGVEVAIKANTEQASKPIIVSRFL